MLCPEEAEKRYLFVVNEFYREEIKTLSDGSQRRIGFDCSVTAEQGRSLYDVVRILRPVKSLEIGLAWGGSAIHILCGIQANGVGHHTALDPYQHGWSNIGVSEPARLGLSEYLTCLYERSDAAMPRMLNDNERFEFIFIDGDHRFDSAFVDYYYSQLLLSIGGILMFDDAQALSVARVISFVEANMPNLERIDIPSFGRFAAFCKKNEDRRSSGHEFPF